MPIEDAFSRLILLLVAFLILILAYILSKGEG